MDLGMFNRVYPSLKAGALIDEIRFDMIIYDKNSDRYVIPIDRKNVWTNKWMQDPRKSFFQISYHDRSAQYIGSWGSFIINIGVTLYYSCRRPGHIAKECLGRGSSCLCCKSMDHEVLDCPRMIARMEEMNLNQENPMADPEEAEPQQESEKVLMQIKEILNDHRYVRLSDIFKEKECIEARIGDFDIESVLDEET
jgi:hypothetical protein